MRRLWHWEGIVFVLALSLRLVHAFQMSASPLFTMPAVDAATYAEQAASLAEGNWLGRGQGPFWQPPLYPYFSGRNQARILQNPFTTHPALRRR